VSDRDWFIDTYDAAIDESADDGAELEKARDTVAHEYADAVTAGVQPRHSMSLVDEGRELFDTFIGPERKRRKSSMRDQVAYLLDAFESGDDDGAYVDPILAHAYPLGDGRDKSLRYWTADDWTTATTERYRNAAKVTAAAADFDENTAARAIAAMRARGVLRVGDLFL
jgi:hypothetical protein